MLQDLQDLQTQMGHIHIHWQRNTIHHQCIQTHRPKNNFRYQQHFRKPAQSKNPPPHPPTNSQHQDSTNLPAQIAISSTWDRPEDAFQNVMMNTKRAFHTNSHTSNFANHLLEEAHSFAPISNIIQVLHHKKKGAHLNTMGSFYIHVKHANGNHLNDDHTIFPNKIFDALIQTK